MALGNAALVAGFALAGIVALADLNGKLTKLWKSHAKTNRLDLGAKLQIAR